MIDADLFWTPEFKASSDDRVCYFNNELCLDKQRKLIEIKPTRRNMISASIIVITLATASLIMVDHLTGTTFNPFRLFTVSFVSGIIGFLAVIFNKPILRSLFLSLTIVMLFLLPIVYVVDVIYGIQTSIIKDVLFVQLGIQNTIEDPYKICLITHTPHYIMLFLLFLRKVPLPHQSILIGAGFWFVEISIAYLIFPNGKTFYYLSYLPTILIIETGIFIMWIIVFIIEKRRIKSIEME